MARSCSPTGRSTSRCSVRRSRRSRGSTRPSATSRCDSSNRLGALEEDEPAAGASGSARSTVARRRPDRAARGDHSSRRAHNPRRRHRSSSSLALTSQSSDRLARASPRSWACCSDGTARPLASCWSTERPSTARASTRCVSRRRGSIRPSSSGTDRSSRTSSSAAASAPGLGTRIARADLRGVIEQLPDGLQTTLGEGGTLVSGGEGQRVRFGRGLGRPDARLVILDEPFRGLERSRRATLLRRAREQWSRATLVCVTHDVGETATLRPGARRLQRSGGRGRRAGRSGGPGRLALSIHPRRGDHASRSGCGRIPRGGRCDSRTGGSWPPRTPSHPTRAPRRRQHPSGRGITKAAGGRLSGIAAVCWPIQRAPEGLELLARAARFPCRPTHRSSEAEPRAQDVDASLKDAAAALGLEVESVDASFGEIGSLLRSAGPAVIRIGADAVGDARETTRTPADRDRTRPSRSSGSGRRRCGGRSSILKRRRSSPMPKGSPTKPAFAPPIDPPSRARSSRNGCARGGCAACGCFASRQAPASARRSPPPAGGGNSSCWRSRTSSQYGLWIAAWWLLGRAALQGRLDASWLTAWTLALFTLVPLQLAGALAPGPGGDLGGRSAQATPSRPARSGWSLRKSGAKERDTCSAA